MWDEPSFLKLAGNLEGKLLFIYGPHGEDVERLARALVDANKFFDVLPMPGADHSFRGDAGRYMIEAARRYFDEHLK